MLKKILFLVLTIIYWFWLSIILGYNIKNPELKWDWNQLETQNFIFPENFIWGIATSAHQVEGNNLNNNWYLFENQIKKNNIPNIYNGDRSGLASNHWNLYDKDIQLMKKLGVDHYRFSIEWSKIEPEQGVFDYTIIDHYQKKIDALINNKITPVITLHHFTNPIWFEEKGAFEKSENIKYFVDFSSFAFKQFSSSVLFWCTINEPMVYVYEGYFNGVFPPAKKDPVLAIKVLKNMLNAHVLVYKRLKTMTNGNKVKIGMVKNIFQFDPLNRLNILDWYMSSLLNDIFTNEPINFFKNGRSSFFMPGFVNDQIVNDDAKSSLDFIGLNYYSRFHVKGKINLSEPFIFKTRKQDIQTDMNYPMYPEGIYKALKTIDKLNVPIYITENGIADSTDSNRAIFINQYLYSTNKALREGVDVKGYFYWSLMDNFEWAKGYSMKFGLYEVDFKTQERKLRDGSKSLINIIKRSKNKIQIK